MSLSLDEEKAIRSYLLGELAPQETLAVEERLLGEDAFAEQLSLLEDELVEDYARGALRDRERERFESHFLSSPRRRRKLMLVNGIRKQAAGSRQAGARARGRFISLSSLVRPFFVPGWRAAVLAVLIAAVGLGVWRAFFHQSRIDEGMVALNDAYAKQRPLEARITGLSYAPYASTRGGAAGEEDYRARDLALGIFLEEARRKPTPDALHALGRAYLARKELHKAIEQFSAATEAKPDDAQSHSDMGAALLEAGWQAEQRQDGAAAMESYARSLGHLEKALQLNPRLPEALYNRALVMERQPLPKRQAEEAWRLYLSLDPDPRSGWAEEARQHLKLLSEQGAAVPTPQQLLEEFMRAARAGDDERAWLLMSHNREMIAGRFLPQRLAASHLRERAEGRERESKELLDALAYAGRLERERAHDPYVADMAAFYSRATAGEWATLGQAQAAVAAGYALCIDENFKGALEQFVKAGELFARAGDVWESRLCDYWVGYCLNEGDEIARSTALLRGLADYSGERGYKWLFAQAICWIATNYAEAGEHSKSIEYYNRALPIVEEIDDTYNLQKILSQLASQYNQLGQPQRALGYNWRSLRVAEAAHPGARQLWRNYLYTTRTLISLKLYDTAAAFGSAMLQVAVNDIRAANTIRYSYHYLGQIHGELRQYEEAIRLTNESVGIARSLADGPAARKQITYALLQIAHLQRQAGRCAQALGIYDEVIRTFDGMEQGAYRYNALKGRLLCRVALEDNAAFEAELPVVLEQFEKYRLKIVEEQDSNAFFDREQGVYDIAIDHAYAGGDEERAFAYSEMSRARSLLETLRRNGRPGVTPAVETPAPESFSPPLGLRELQRLIPADVQLIQYAMLEDRTLIWVVTNKSVTSAKSEIPAADLQAKILTYVKGIGAPGDRSRAELKRLAAELYDALIRPVEQGLDPGKIVCIVPDKSIYRLPFSALVSPRSGRYLVSEFLLQYAPSLNVFVRCSGANRDGAGTGAETLLSIGDPSFDSADYPALERLPAAAREARGISRYYEPAATRVLVGQEAVREAVESELSKADVINFAGHYVADERDPMSSRLVLAKGNGRAGEDDGSITIRRLCGKKLPRAKLVVLSACETGGGRYYNGEGVISPSRAFLGSGIPLVVSSLWAIDSEATAEVMLRFHRYRKAERLTTVAALRRAQLDLLDEPGGAHQDPYYWAAFLASGGHANF